MSCSPATEICAPSGSDVRLSITISDTSGPLDLTGWTTNLFDLAQPLVGRVTAQITAPSSGVIAITIDGSTPLSIGRYWFRLQMNSPTDSLALPQFVLTVV